MQTAQTPAISTWFTAESEEEGMHEDHAYLWRHFLSLLPETDLRSCDVLDYGCNRGGFLDLLYRERRFRRGVGVDIAAQSLALARQRHMDLQVDFVSPHQLDRFAASIHVAFSHEVIYLLPDLAAHAALIARLLRPGGSYYAVTGCHTANPHWPLWRTLIGQSTSLPLFDYSLDDYAKAFWQAGLTVQMRPFALDDFVLIKPDNPYFPSAADSLAYHTHVKTVIRARKAA